MYRYRVPEMSCGHCVAAITDAVRTVDPAASIDTDLETKEVSVESTAETGRIASAMKEAGYESQRLPD